MFKNSTVLPSYVSTWKIIDILKKKKKNIYIYIYAVRDYTFRQIFYSNLEKKKQDVCKYIRGG